VLTSLVEPRDLIGLCVNKTEHEGIMAIFLAEAEEIVQRLSEQLTELQYGYDGQRILDDIHRGFHTLYGGAAVLGLVELVECAQLSERLMERLRTRRMALNPAAVSLILSAVETIQVMLARRINHQPPEALSRELKQRLVQAANGNDKSANTIVSPQANSDPMGLFFDGRLAPRQPDSRLNLDSGGILQSVAAAEITDDEFENILDSLYGKGRGPTSRRVASRRNEAAAGSATETMVRPQAVLATEVAADDSGIGHLVQELSWVRNRLIRFQGLEQKTELDKALAYLDLVTRDMEAWLQNRAKSR
jgi:two-component system chemotaxis sensor kinase CheA